MSAVFSIPGHTIGIDVSHHKKWIDWADVQSCGVRFAIIKASEADQFVDPFFDQNWTRARRAKIIRGAYHFFRPVVDPYLQSGNFLRTVGDVLHETDLPPVLDVQAYPDFVKQEYDQLSLDDRIRRLKTWLKVVEEATGRIPMIHTDQPSWAQTFGNSDEFCAYPLWISSLQGYRPRLPANHWGGQGWTFWQITDKGKIPGIIQGSPFTDINVFRGDEEALKAWLGSISERAIPPDVSNGEMMAALTDTADALEICRDDLVDRAGLRYLVDPIGNNARPYDGPAVQDLPISDEEKDRLEHALSGMIEDLSPSKNMIVEVDTDINISDEVADTISGGDNASEEIESIAEKGEEGGAAAYRAIDNQAVLHAFNLTAIELGMDSKSLIEVAGLSNLIEDRLGTYNGPKIEDLPGLTIEQIAHIAEILNIEIDFPVYREDIDTETISMVKPEEGDIPIFAWPVLPEGVGSTAVCERDEERIEVVDAINPGSNPYPGLINQDMINIFYRVAAQFGENGWDWLVRLGLAKINESREMRFQGYSGPRVEKFPHITEEQRQVFQCELDLLKRF